MTVVTAAADQVAQLPDSRIVIAKPPDIEICGSCNGHDIARSGDVGSSCYSCDGGANDVPPDDLVAVTERCKTCKGRGFTNYMFCEECGGHCLGVPKSVCPDCHAGRPLFDLKVECPLEDVEALADLEHGEEVEITWSGGNGPHRYRVNQAGEDGVYAVSGEPFDSSNPTWDYNPITFVGTEPYHTRVTRWVTHASLYVPGPLLPMLDGDAKTSDYPPDGFYLTRGEGWWLDSDFDLICDLPAARPRWYAAIAERRRP